LPALDTLMLTVTLGQQWVPAWQKHVCREEAMLVTKNSQQAIADEPLEELQQKLESVKRALRGKEESPATAEEAAGQDTGNQAGPSLVPQLACFVACFSSAAKREEHHDNDDKIYTHPVMTGQFRSHAAM
jgi:hypothetical protein